MHEMKELFQSADWKAEKHVPVIECVDSIQKGSRIDVTITVGKQIPHPNKTEHHIRWIEVFFQPDGERFPYQVAAIEFTSHGESTQGPDTSTVYTEPCVVLGFKTEKSGIIFAASYCNIHGLWQSSKKITVA
jgi:superoxide reductase